MIRHSKLSASLKRQLTRAFSSSQQLPDQADVVVVGGGSLGASTLYHLQSRGINSILLEKDKLTCGTTWHSAGMLWRFRLGETELELGDHSRNMAIELEETTGEVAWRQNGGLFIANSKERLTEYQRMAEVGRYYNIPSQVLSPSETQQIHPLMRTDDIYGSIYSPTDGTLDPNNIVMAYAKGAKKQGAKVFEGTGVAGVSTESFQTAGGLTKRKVSGVTTVCGHHIKTKQIVNACGAWANNFCSLADITIPLRAMKHAYIVTEGLPGMHSMLPNVRDHDYRIYMTTRGNAMALGGYEMNPEFVNLENDFSFGLYDPNWDTFNQTMEGHLHRVPISNECEIQSTVFGPESFTPDNKPLVGPDPSLNGFFHACGFSSSGMMLGGGVGNQVAIWLDEGSPKLDMFGMDITRFTPSSVTNDKFVRDKVSEGYSQKYNIVFPHDEPLAGRNFKTSGLHEELLARGCMFQARHGYERPGWFIRQKCQMGKYRNEPNYGPKDYDYNGGYEEGAWRLTGDPDSEIEGIPKHEDHPYDAILQGELTYDFPASFSIIKKEVQACREGVAIFDQSYFGKFILKGKDVDAAVQYLCGADFEGKTLGQVTYTPLCNQRGGVEADPTVTKLSDGSGYYIAAGGSVRLHDWTWINKVLEEGNFDVQMTDLSDELDLINVQGPHSRKLLQRMISSGHTLSDEEIPFSHMLDIEMNGVKIMCLRLTFMGELGFELHVPRTESANIYRLLRSTGDEYEKETGAPVRDAGYRAIDSLSAEKGFRHWHADLTNRDTPLEAGIGFTVLKKLKRTGEDAPDFIGRKALEEQRANGLKKKLVCLILDDDKVPLHGMETIWRNGVVVGLIKSTAFGHTIGKTIAYGYVDAEKAGAKKITNKWLEAGEWQLGVIGEMHDATLSPKAPFDPENKRIRDDYGDVSYTLPHLNLGQDAQNL